jgi:RNA polymerase primary sigma factor
MIGEEELRQVHALLEPLSLREATVLRLRFGLTGEEPMTLKQVGEHLGITRERVRQIEHNGLRRLREQLEAN